jgi:hypothetical protein
MASWECRVCARLDRKHCIPREVRPFQNPANILRIVDGQHGKIVANLVSHTSWQLQDDMSLLGLSFSSKKLVADNNGFLDILSKFGSSGVCIDLNINASLFL